jgi:hypothetical protein
MLKSSSSYIKVLFMIALDKCYKIKSFTLPSIGVAHIFGKYYLNTEYCTE